MILPENWRGHVMEVTHHKTVKPKYNMKKIAVPVWYQPNLPVTNRNQPKFHPNGYRSGPEPEFRSGPKINPINKFII